MKLSMLESFGLAAFVLAVILLALAVTGDENTQPTDIQPAHVEIDAHTLALSTLLMVADKHERCEEDELWWFTGDYDGRQWTRACIPMDRMVE